MNKDDRTGVLSGVTKIEIRLRVPEPTVSLALTCCGIPTLMFSLQGLAQRVLVYDCDNAADVEVLAQRLAQVQEVVDELPLRGASVTNPVLVDADRLVKGDTHGR